MSADAAPSPKPSSKPPWPPGAMLALVTLSVTMVITWGTLFYGVTLIGPRVMAETGWSKTLIYGAFSLALLASGLAAPRVGALIDAHGGRWVMAAGAAVAASATSRWPTPIRSPSSTPPGC